MCNEHCMGCFSERLPPAIIKGPKMRRIFREDATIKMTCIATASVAITYVSTFAMQLINISRLESQTNADKMFKRLLLWAGYYKTKLYSLRCKSHRFTAARVEILSTNSTQKY